MADIPLEILAAILSRLPAKSLMRFCCVSKPWCALIGSRDFVKMHLKQAQESARFHKLVIRRNSGTVLSSDVDSLDQALPLNPPCFPSDFSYSCNGLILLVDENNSLLIWNPFTRKYTTLPPLPMDPENASSIWKTTVINIKYGFGYDSLNDDYKVLRALTWQSIGNEHLGFGCEAKVYSLKSNTWKKTVHSPVPIPDFGRWAAHVNGVLHTLVSKQYIIGFDLATEESHRIPLPEGLQVDTEESDEFPLLLGEMFDGMVNAFNYTVKVDLLDLTLVTLKGFLCLHCKEKKNHNIHIWIMKEYGVKESWTKLLSLAPPLIPADASVFPVTFSISDQNVLLNMNNELVWFDLKRDAFIEADVQGSWDGDQALSMSHAEFCVETIDSPDCYGEGVIEPRSPFTREEM